MTPPPTTPTTQPTAAAWNAALALCSQGAPRSIIERYATIIDAETGLPGLIAALELCLEDAERQSRADAPGVEPDWAKDVHAALAAAGVKPERT